MINLNLLVLRCQDIERSRAFYELIGLSFTKHRHGSGPEHYAHEDERGVIELYPLPEAPASPQGDMTGVGFFASDLPSLHQRMSHLAYAPQPIRDNPWGRTFVVRDPDGRRVEIKDRGAVPREGSG